MALAETVGREGKIMKKKHYTVLLALLMIIVLAILFLCRQSRKNKNGISVGNMLKTVPVAQEPMVENGIMEVVQEQETPENDSETMATLSEGEISAKIYQEHDRLMGIMWALCNEYEQYLLVKYADLNLTREERHQRVRELDRGNADERREAKELGDYDVALHYATESSADGGDRLVVSPDTAEFKELRRTMRQLASAAAMGQDAMVDIRNGEIRIPPDTVEYHTLLRELFGLSRKPELTDEESERMRQIIREARKRAKTNTPTSAFQMPKEECP